MRNINRSSSVKKSKVIILDMRVQEQLQPEGRGKIYAAPKPVSFSVTETDAKKVVLERSRMLASIEHYLSESEREAIQKKLEREKQLILSMVKTEKKPQAVPGKSPLVLNQAYFKRRTIDNNIFE